MLAAVLVPAYQAEGLVGDVVRELVAIWPSGDPIVVIDDGSTDATRRVAAEAGAHVIRHPQNRGKGSALRTGLNWAEQHGFETAVTIDADGQHPPREALRMHQSCPDPGALVIGVRDLEAAGAPRPNQLSNRFSNLVIGAFCGRALADTQSGLRRYPVDATLALGGVEAGYGYEAEILIRASTTAIPIVELPIQVIYPPEEERLSHFDSVRDPVKIVRRVVQTTASTRARWLIGMLAKGRAGNARR